MPNFMKKIKEQNQQEGNKPYSYFPCSVQTIHDSLAVITSMVERKVFFVCFVTNFL